MATVNSTTTSTSLLSSNSQRRGAVITNTDANPLYILMGTGTASSSNNHYVLNTGDTLELPHGFTGDVQGKWSAAGSGAAVSVEF
jgi:hypothetical protein